MAAGSEAVSDEGVVVVAEDAAVVSEEEYAVSYLQLRSIPSPL